MANHTENKEDSTTPTAGDVVSDHLLPEGVSEEGRATRNFIIRDATAKVLKYVKKLNNVTPDEVERLVIDAVNTRLSLVNKQGGDYKNPLPLIKELSFAQIAQIMMALYTIVRIAPSGKNTEPDYDLLAVYRPNGPLEGIYDTSETYLRSIARSFCYGLKTKEADEVMAMIKDLSPRVHRCSDRDLIAVQNGLFNYKTKKLQPFDPKHVFIAKSEVAYNPDAKNVVIHNTDDGTDWDVESWMADLSDDPEIVNLLWEITGAVIRSHVRWNKSAWFYSEAGNNGKGTLIQLLRNLCGESSYASIPLSDFSKDFQLEPLTRASAILVDENDVGGFIDKAGNLKAVITGDVISINRKHKTPIAYQFCGFMVQCINELPKVRDRSESFYRRQIFVPFTKCFTGVERKYIKNDYLCRADVLEYVLKRVLHMNYYELSEPQSTKDALNEYREYNDPVRGFWNEHKGDFTWDLLPFSFLYETYQAWFSANSPSGSPVGKNTFIKDLLAIIDADRRQGIPQAFGCEGRDKRYRGTDRMEKPEPLVEFYGLKNWANDSYDGIDGQRKCRVSKLKSAESFRGLIRLASNDYLVNVANQQLNPQDSVVVDTKPAVDLEAFGPVKRVVVTSLNARDFDEGKKFDPIDNTMIVPFEQKSRQSFDQHQTHDSTPKSIDTVRQAATALISELGDDDIAKKAAAMMQQLISLLDTKDDQSDTTDDCSVEDASDDNNDDNADNNRADLIAIPSTNPDDDTRDDLSVSHIIDENDEYGSESALINEDFYLDPDDESSPVVELKPSNIEEKTPVIKTDTPKDTVGKDTDEHNPD